MNLMAGKNLLSAAERGDLQQVETLIKKNPKLITHASFYGNNALHNAAANGRLEVVVWLVQQGGASPLVLDGKGQTALQRAKNSSHEAVVQFLESVVNNKNNEGQAQTGNRGVTPRNANEAEEDADGVIVDKDEQDPELASALKNTNRAHTDPSPSLINMFGNGLRSSVTAVGGTVASMGSSTKKALGFGMGKISIVLPPYIYQPGRDRIVGVVRLVDLPEPIQGTSLTIHLQAFRECTSYDCRDGRHRTTNKQIFNFGQSLDGTRTYRNNQVVRFVLPVPVLQQQQKLSHGQDPSTTLGSILTAVDSVRSLTQSPIKWYVSARLSIPRSVGLGHQVSVVVAEPGQTVPLAQRAPPPTPPAVGRRVLRPNQRRPTNNNPRTTTTAPNAAAAPPANGLVSANGKLCNICYMDEHDPNVLALACNNQHYLCLPCFSAWVESESDIDGNPQKVIQNGGKIHCVCKQTHRCTSEAFGSKLIASATSDDVYEKYLRAREFVVGKEAVSGALSNISLGTGSMNSVEQEQIRNMYRTGDGSYSTYMCGQCQFGPIDHGWCNNLSTHHGEEKSNNTSASETTPRSVVNNSCPKCGWFADDIGAWPKWDGTFHEEPARDNEEEEGASSGQENLDNDNTDKEAPAPDTEQEEGTGSGQDNLNNENAGEGNRQAQPVESALL